MQLSSYFLCAVDITSKLIVYYSKGCICLEVSITVTFPRHKVNPKLQNGREVSITFITVMNNDMYIYININK